jgi:hypothetical protein
MVESAFADTRQAANFRHAGSVVTAAAKYIHRCGHDLFSGFFTTLLGHK